MKIFNIKHQIILLFIFSFYLMGCVHDDDYNSPPQNKGQVLTPTLSIAEVHSTAPVYTGNTVNDTIPESIPFKKGDILEGYVISTDEGGNIYKNLFIVSEDGKQGIMLSINKSSTYNMYPLGSKIYVKLDGLYYGKQNGMVQIGMKPTQSKKYIVDQINPNIISSNIILGVDKKSEEELVIKTNSAGEPLTVNDVKNNEKYLNTLVEISDVEFNEAGSTFVRGNLNTNNQVDTIKVTNFTVRVSNYAAFGGNIIPYDKGKLRGVMTRYDGKYNTYQLLIRTINDVKEFPKTIYAESFNKVNDIAGKPKIGIATGYDNKMVTYSDPYGKTDIRTSGTAFQSPAIWFPSNTNASLVIDKIDTQGYTNMKLSYRFNANIFAAADKAYVDDLVIKCNDIKIQLPHKELNVSNNKNIYYTVKVAIPDGTTKIEFLGQSEKNKLGMRIDNIRIGN